MSGAFTLWLAILLRNFTSLGVYGHKSESLQERLYYTAAVVEYAPEGNSWELSPPEIIAANVNNYLSLIAQASTQDADIIVFPEYGLTTLGMPKDRQSSKSFLLRVPRVGENPCQNRDSWSQNVVLLACAAKSNGIYVVINLGEIRDCELDQNDCPEDGAFHYNTNVVFDRSGAVISKYEKGNLYFEDQFDKPNPIQLSTFATDFGVIFGVFTCFDIIFQDPPIRLLENGLNIRNFVFPTAWVDEFPYMTGIQAQESWAHSVNANLLASGYHRPIGGQMGSGIYSGNIGALNYTFDTESGTTLILGRVPVIPGNEEIVKSNQNCPSLSEESEVSRDTRKFDEKSIREFHSYLREDLQNYTTKMLDVSSPDLVDDEVCTENGFCCKIEYEMSETSNSIEFEACKTSSTQNYRLIAMNGTRYVAAKTSEFDWQVCSVVRCFNETLESCSENNQKSSELPTFKKLTLSSKFDIQESKIFLPGQSFIDVNMDLIPFTNFKNSMDVNSGEMTITSSTLSYINIKTVAIINKFYS